MCNGCQAHIARLVAENETLAEELAQLKSHLYGLGWAVPEALKLTKTEGAVLGALMGGTQVDSRRIIPEWLIYDAAYAGRIVDHAAGSNIIHVFISKIRTKLKPYGMSVETVWGQGYRLPIDTRAKLLNWNTTRAAA